MNEYKNPIKKMWQQANQPIVDGNNVQLPHTLGTAAPTTTPAKVGLLFIVTGATPEIYISTGTTDSGDWTQIF